MTSIWSYIEGNIFRIPQEFFDDVHNHFVVFNRAKDQPTGDSGIALTLKGIRDKEILPGHETPLDKFANVHISESTYYNTKNGKGSIQYKLVDFLSFAAFGKSIVQKVTQYSPQLPVYEIVIPERVLTALKKEDVESRPNIASSFSIENNTPTFQVINEAYFDKYKTRTSDVIILKRAFYLKFESSKHVISEIIARKEYIDPGRTFKFRIDDEETKCDIIDLVNQAAVGNPVLIKILGVSGAGKTTLMWHFMRELYSSYHCIYLSDLETDVFQDLVQNIPTSPVLLFLDNIVSNNHNSSLSKNLIAFRDALIEYSNITSVVFFCVERTTRYIPHVDRLFEEGLFLNYTLYYSNPLIRSDIFEEIFSLINKRNIDDIAFFKNECKAHWDDDFESITDQIVNLLDSLDQNLPDIQYDWDDWYKACKKPFDLFGNFYKVVAFFSQFGVGVPVNYLYDFYNETSAIDRTQLKDRFFELIHLFKGTISPLEFDYETNHIRLRNEKIARWFFKKNNVGSDFFDTFISRINSEASAYLFRNLYDKNLEFANSPFIHRVSREKALMTIEQYLVLRKGVKFGEIEFKMLMLSHRLLFDLGRTTESLAPLRKVIALDPEDKHASTRLASLIQFHNPKEAEQLYTKVSKIEPLNTYAKFGLYNLYLRTNDANQSETVREIVTISKGNTEYYLLFVDYLLRYVEKIPNSTLDLLSELHIACNVQLKFISLLMVKKKYLKAHELLVKFNDQDISLTRGILNKIASYLIQLSDILYEAKNDCLTIAERFITRSNATYPQNPNTYLLYGKWLQRKGQYVAAEDCLITAFKMDPRGDIFLSICRYFQQEAKRTFSINILETIQTLNKGVKFVQEVMAVEVGRYLMGRYLELANFKVELARAYFFNKNREDSVANEREAIEILEGYISVLQKKIPDFHTDYSLNPQNGAAYTNLSKCYTILGKLYRESAERLATSPLVPNKIVVEERTKARNNFLSSYKIRSDDVWTLLKLIEIKLILADNDIEDFIKNISFSDFSNRHKIDLCYYLVNSSYLTITRTLLLNFGKIECDDSRYNEKLAECYIYCKLWKRGIKLLSEIDKFNGSLSLSAKVACELPFDYSELVHYRIKFCKKLLRCSWYINNEICRIYFQKEQGIHEYRTTLHLFIIETLFCTGRYSEAYNYYNKWLSRDDCQRFKFNDLKSSWTPNLMLYFDDKTKKVCGKYRSNKSLENSQAVHECLLQIMEAPLLFSKIEFQYRNNNLQSEKIKRVVRRLINEIFSGNNTGKGGNLQVGNAIEQIIKKKNDLVNKIILQKISDSPTYALHMKEIYPFLLNEYKTNSEILTLLATAYLQIHFFEKANKLAVTALDKADNNIRKGRAYFCLANLVITKAEFYGEMDLTALKNTIEQAENYLELGRQKMPFFEKLLKYHERLKPLKARLL